MTDEQARQLLTDLIADYKAAGRTLADLGADIARRIAADHKPLSKQHINGMRNGSLPISRATAQALRELAAIADGVDETEAQARPVTVALLALHDLPANALIMDPPHKCALDGCNVVIVGRHKYHSRACQKEAAKLR